MQFTEAVKVAEVFRVFEDVRQLAEAGKVTQILIDTRASISRLTVKDRLQMALAVVDKFRGYRVAGVVSAAMIDPQRLGETMAVNRGAKIKIFLSLPEAVEWLDGFTGGSAKHPAPDGGGTAAQT